MVDQPSLFESSPVARRTDPETSWQAARSVKHLRESQTIMLGRLRVGPATDEDLYRWPVINKTMSPSGARTRRKELVDMGLVEDSGVRDKTRSGRKTIVWRVVEMPDD